MPFYDFRCHDCRRPARLFFTFEEYDSAEPTCPHCDSRNLRRRIGRIAIAKSEDGRMDSMLDDADFSALENEDPRELGRFMRKMSHEMGEDLGEEFGEVVDRLERGQSPDEIEKAMPELADDGGVMGGMNDF